MIFPQERFAPSLDDYDVLAAYAIRSEPKSPKQSADTNKDDNKDAYTQLLRRELIGQNQNLDLAGRTPGYRPPAYFEDARVLKFSENTPPYLPEHLYLTPIPLYSKAMAISRKPPRKIAKVPYKVLDAPQLQDDFYLNLVDWSSANTLAVGLSSSVYLWAACTSRVSRMCDLGSDDTVTSVAWSQRGSHLAVGTNKGDVLLWDVQADRLVRTFEGHQSRVGSMAWNESDVLSTGSRDHSIMQRDPRSPAHYLERLAAHKQEVCGLKWSFDGQQLASGGNDNKLFIWNLHSRSPVLKFSGHQAAVKAIGWSPHQHGLLASGGGTADRSIRFWNTVTNSALNSVDTGSQVCNLVWSKTVTELVSTHGYSLNQIIVWKYPSMTKVATLTGHTYRVLYLSMSPDGQTIVTGAGDETLRFWNIFPGARNSSEGSSDALTVASAISIR